MPIRATFPDHNSLLDVTNLTVVSVGDLLNTFKFEMNVISFKESARTAL